MAAMSVAILALAGCATKSPDFVPTTQSAEIAVRQGLDAWKAGHPPGEVPGTSSPMIFVNDTGRKPGQILKDFQILGETRGSAGRTVVVNLQLANPDEVVKTAYIVVGIDPLWVFRQEDYELLMHWDHRMPAEAQGASEAAPVSSATEGSTIQSVPSQPADSKAQPDSAPEPAMPLESNSTESTPEKNTP